MQTINKYWRHLTQTSARFNKSSFMNGIRESQISLLLGEFDLTELPLMWSKRETVKLSAPGIWSLC